MITSPTINSNYPCKLIIYLAHLSFSEPKALTNLYARSSLLEHLSASATAAFFSAMALSNLDVKSANYAFNIATFSSTSFNLIEASSNYSVASFNTFLLGSIS